MPVKSWCTSTSCCGKGSSSKREALAHLMVIHRSRFSPTMHRLSSSVGNYMLQGPAPRHELGRVQVSRSKSNRGPAGGWRRQRPQPQSSSRTAGHIAVAASACTGSLLSQAATRSTHQSATSTTLQWRCSLPGATHPPWYRTSSTKVIIKRARACELRPVSGCCPLTACRVLWMCPGLRTGWLITVCA